MNRARRGKFNFAGPCIEGGHNMVDLLEPEEFIDDKRDFVLEKLTLLADLHSTTEFEDEKIDLVIRPGAPDEDLPIFRTAKAEGIKL